ncbi:DUF4328 domain-containing protein [Streptomyces sp. NPDC051217]|uniref:DUF4328 domain-containing protein n=1 Tax=Streptomyces sp. NPDC051217 TaxID=3365644 RepID=UPI0037A419D4
MKPNATHTVAPSPASLAVPRSPIGLGLATSLLLGAVIVTDVLSLASGAYLYDLLRGAPHAEAALWTVPGVEDRQLSYDLFGLLQSAFYLSTGIVYVCWLYRSRDNAEVFAPGTQRRGRSWTGWGWLVPVVNLWFPRRVTLDIWNASRSVGPNSPDRVGPGLINLWWGFWLAQGFIALAGGAVYDTAESIGPTNVGLGLLMVSDLVDIVSAVLALRLVRTLTHMQHVKARHGLTAQEGESFS